MVIDDNYQTPLHILVVDGSDSERQLSVAVIQSRGHIVDVARNSHEALKKAFEIPFDLIFTELKFPAEGGLDSPQYDGFETTQLIRNFTATRGLVPIIGLSKTQSGDDVRRCFTVGMSNFIPKPLTVSKLEAIARSYSQRKAVHVPVQQFDHWHPQR